jgi:hypothetical protein
LTIAAVVSVPLLEGCDAGSSLTDVVTNTSNADTPVSVPMGPALATVGGAKMVTDASARARLGVTTKIVIVRADATALAADTTRWTHRRHEVHSYGIEKNFQCPPLRARFDTNGNVV